MLQVKTHHGCSQCNDNLVSVDEKIILIIFLGACRSVCVEIELDALAVNTLLQSHHVHDIEGTY